MFAMLSMKTVGWWTFVTIILSACIVATTTTEPHLLIDGHNDFPIWTRAYYHNHIYTSNFTSTTQLFGQVDFPRLRKGGLSAQFWSVYVECPSVLNKSDFRDEVYYENIHDTLQQIDLVKRIIDRFPRYLQAANSASDVRRQQQRKQESIHFNSPYLQTPLEPADDDDNEPLSSNPSSSPSPSPPPPPPSPPPISSLMGIEGLHQIGNSLSILRMYHAIGVRYATLTHTCHNSYADSEGPAEPMHNGLSPRRGHQLIHEMNRLGMMIDLSHTSFATQRDALAITRAPIVFTHSNAYAVCNHSRNVPDDILHMVKRNGGVVMATFYPEFVNNKQVAKLTDVADHIEYIGSLIGYEHVGIGSDFDGMPAGPEGLEDVSKYPDLIDELRRRGIGEDDLKNLMGLNVLRVLEAVEQVALDMRAEGVLPVEDDVKEFFKR